MHKSSRCLTRTDVLSAHQQPWHVLMQVERLAALQQVFTGFMEEVISGMAGYIPLKAIGQRILAQYSRQQFGDFRGTLLGLLSAYSYESSILTTARCNLLHSLHVLQKRGSSKMPARQLLPCQDKIQTVHCHA